MPENPLPLSSAGSPERASLRLPENDYISPGMVLVMPDSAFPHMVVGDTSLPQWPWLRRWVGQNWYTDRRSPLVGFASRDEAAILYNNALLFKNQNCLEVGCWRGWSAVHIALGAGHLDIIDPIFHDDAIANDVRKACEAAGVLQKVTFHKGFSPAAINELAVGGKKWSMIFIDGDHEGDAPVMDAIAAMRHAASTAMILFHDLASPYVAAGLDALRDAGWNTMLYQTMQIMGVAWRGDVEPVHHVPDPSVHWTLPQHLESYRVCGSEIARVPQSASWRPGMDDKEQLAAAMARGQAAEDELVIALRARDIANARLSALEQEHAANHATRKALEHLHAALEEENAASEAARKALEHKHAALEQEHAASEAARKALEHEYAALEREHAASQEAYKALVHNHATLEQEHAASEAARKALEHEYAALEREHAASQEAYKALVHNHATLEQEHAASQLICEELEQTLSRERRRADEAEYESIRQAESRQEALSRMAAIESSLSWRATAILRHQFSRHPRMARTLRRGMKLAWWTITLQLLGKLRARHHAQQALQAEAQARAAALETELQKERAARDVDNAADSQVSNELFNVSTLLVDWLAAFHNPPHPDHVPILGTDTLLIYFQDMGVVGEAASIMVRTLREGFDPAQQQKLNEIFAHAIQQPNKYLAELAREVAACSLFDAQDYASRASLKANALEAAMHYLLLGEPLGLCPSTNFNPNYYLLRHDDLILIGCNALLHYTRHGSGEGRSFLPHCPSPVPGRRAEDPQRENIILAVHETSRTGAPILGWNIASRLSAEYNLFTISLSGGPLTPEFEVISVEVHGPFSKSRTNETDAEYGLRSLFANRVFKYAIINSIECRGLLQACAKAGVPTVLLVHEFSSYVAPYSGLIKAYRDANEIVFPAPIVARAALDCDPALVTRSYHVIPQGMSALPTRTETVNNSEDPKIQTLAALRAGGTMIILGAGTVDMRKGVDLFMEVAAGVQRRGPARPVHFVWVGGGYRPREDLGYSLYLAEQLNRSELTDHFTFVDEVIDLEPIYSLAHAFLLTSRLDPLPNVTIDAAMRGIPVICFKNASGMADLLLAEPETRKGVVPYLDSAAAAEVIVQLAGDEASRCALAAATKQFAARTFDMNRYVNELDRLGNQAATRAACSFWFDAPWYAAQYKAVRDHAAYVTKGLAMGHAPGPIAADILARFSQETQFSFGLYDQFRRAVTWKHPIAPESLSLLTALYVPAWHTRPGLDGFLAFLREGLAADIKPGPLFDSSLYWARAGTANLPPAEPGESAIIHWLRHGVTARIVPTTRFDEDFYRASNPDLRALPQWGFAHYLQHGAREGRRPNERTKFYRPQIIPLTAGSLPPIYEAWYAEDFAASAAFAGITTADEERLDAMLNSSWMAETYQEMRELEPEIAALNDITDYLLPPYQDALTVPHAALRARLPAMYYETVICVPWIRTGGADLVAGLLAAALLRICPAERVLILRTDNPHFERADWLPATIDCIDMSDLRAGLTETEAQTLLRVLCRGVGARRVFNVNSRLCWTAMRDNPANMAATHANYAYLFCWDQLHDGTRVGYPAEFFSSTAPYVTAFLTDTEYLKNELSAQYQLGSGAISKIVPLATPAQTAVRPVTIASEIAEAAPLSPCVLWAGRLDRQKRFELVREIAALMPETTFRCWGTALLDAPPDLSGLPLNMVMEGAFESFDDLPLNQAGVWLFTSSWEGMPTTIIELAMRGVAVVASAVGGVPELITPDTGWPMPPEAKASDYAAALYAALADPAGAAKRAKALQDRAAARHDKNTYDAALAALLDQERAL